MKGAIGICRDKPICGKVRDKQMENERKSTREELDDASGSQQKEKARV